MDSTDPAIRFDEVGVCCYCRSWDKESAARPTAGDARLELERRVSAIRRQGRGREYDCILGLSGGIDSSYLAFKVVELGLRPLAVHFDSGWNSEVSVRNIERIVGALQLDLFTVVCDWQAMRAVQRSFFMASLVNCDVPQDHAFIAALLRVAARKGIRTWVSGHNWATEGIMSPAWRGHDSRDWGHIKGVHLQMGGRGLEHFPHAAFIDRFFYFPILKRIRPIAPLNFIPYVKEEARAFLVEKVGWMDYGGKHCESVFTRFFQGHYLPTKFGFDKRKAHLSSLIVSGQKTRAEALLELECPPYTPQLLREDKDFVLKKLGFSKTEWEDIMNRPPRSGADYPSDRVLFRLFGIRPYLGKLKRRLLAQF